MSAEQRRDEGRRLFGQPSQAANPGGAGTSTSSAWSIALAAFTGPSAQADAQTFLASYGPLTGLPDTRLERRGANVYVLASSYAAPSDARAQADLRRIRAITAQGTRPFQGSALLPPATNAEAPTSERDIRAVRAKLGARAAYSVAVARYGLDPGTARERDPTPEELRAFHAAAERAVAEYRARGEDAYFAHSRRGSDVLIGVFPPEAIDGTKQPPVFSAAITDVLSRHPEYLLNGQGMRFGPNNAVARSYPVAIPKD
ncbi:MAG: hypothetical protein SFY95_07405 [Planctomycetota bacterium]|nr:hypothetical protein [Planctomycetota bacterium]